MVRRNRISNEFNNKLVISADAFIQNWDNYKYYGVHPVEIKQHEESAQEFEYTPSRKPERPFFKTDFLTDWELITC